MYACHDDDDDIYKKSYNEERIIARESESRGGILVYIKHKIFNMLAPLHNFCNIWNFSILIHDFLKKIYLNNIFGDLELIFN